MGLDVAYDVDYSVETTGRRPTSRETPGGSTAVIMPLDDDENLIWNDRYLEKLLLHVRSFVHILITRMTRGEPLCRGISRNKWNVDQYWWPVPLLYNRMPAAKVR